MCKFEPGGCCKGIDNQAKGEGIIQAVRESIPKGIHETGGKESACEGIPGRDQ